jgi:hypothetical protein
MSLDKRITRGFIIWLLNMFVIAIFHALYFEPLNFYFFQVLFLVSLVALSIIYLGVRALSLGKSFTLTLAISLVAGNYIYFGKMGDSLDFRLQVLLFLVICIALNIILHFAIKRSALR